MNKRQLLLSVMAPLIAPMIFAGNSPISGLIGSRGALAASQPAMPAPPKAPKDSLKGKRLCIASPVIIDQLTLFYADMQKAAKQSENGLEITVADAKGDFEKQLAQVEEYVASGNCSAVFYLIVVTKESAEAWGNVAQKGEDAKICMLNHSADWVDNVTMNMSNPHYPAGSMIGEAAAAWYKKNGHGGARACWKTPPVQDSWTASRLSRKRSRSWSVGMSNSTRRRSTIRQKAARNKPRICCKPTRK
jgi:ABC-type sugar transport system substrate-binding protein